MKVNLISFLIVIILSYSNCERTSLNKYFKDADLPLPCSAKDPQLNECFKEYFQQILNKHANAHGSKKLHIPPLDPFVLNERRWSFKNSFFDFVFLTNNVKIFNMAETTINKVKLKFNDTDRFVVDNGKFAMELYMTDPEVIIEGDFKVNLHVDDTKIRTKGHFKLKIEKILNHAKLIGKSQLRNGYHYLTIKTVNFEPEIKDFHFEIKSSNENSIIDTVIVNLFNNNIKDIYKDFIRETKLQWEPLILEPLNEFYEHFPIEVMITPD